MIRIIDVRVIASELREARRMSCTMWSGCPQRPLEVRPSSCVCVCVCVRVMCRGRVGRRR